MKKEQKIYDCIIIGAGPAGVQAGLYIARANKSVLVFHDKKIGSLVSAKLIQNFYGVGEVSGDEIYNAGVRQLQDIGVKVIEKKVTSITQDFNDGIFTIFDNEKTYKSKSLVLAVGKDKLSKKDYELLTNTGVSYCAICDGFFYKNKKVAIIGSTSFTFAEFLHLRDVTSDIYVLSNGKTANFDKNMKINIINHKIRRIVHGKTKNVCVEFANETHEEFDGVFIAESELNANAISKILGLQLEQDGSVKVNENMETNIKGVYACGDVVGGTLQIAKCVNDGLIAGLSVIKYINKCNNLQD